jgi:hypothetical protein
MVSNSSDRLTWKKSALQIQCYTGMPQQLRNGMSAMYATKFTHIKMQPDVVIP